MVLLARAKNFIQTEINRYEGKNSCRSDAWKIISQRLLKKIHRELITSFPLLVSPSRLFDYSDIVVISLKKKKRKSFAIRYLCKNIGDTCRSRSSRETLIALISKHNAFKLSDYIGSIEILAKLLSRERRTILHHLYPLSSSTRNQFWRVKILFWKVFQNRN